MLRARLLTATAAVALLAAPAVFAQQAMTPPASPPQSQPSTPAMPAMPAQSTAPATPATPATPAAGGSVVDVLKAKGQFTTLVTALEAARLTETLDTHAAISIFAPTDAAFAALPDADRTRLMDPANVNELRQLLLYHVVVADVNSSQIEGTRGGVETAARSQVQMDGTGDAIRIDDATVVEADIDAANGAIFAIDKVLNPASSRVAAGDAEETATDAAADNAAPPVDETDDAVTPPVESEEVVTPPATTTTPRTTTLNAPNGQPAVSSTTTASPPVVNPTDGQVDGENPDDDTPTPQS